MLTILKIAGFIDNYLFLWLDIFVFKFFFLKVDIKTQLKKFPKKFDTNVLISQFDEYWNKELKNPRKPNRPRLLTTLIRIFKARLIVTGILTIVRVLFIIVTPLLVGLFIIRFNCIYSGEAHDILVVVEIAFLISFLHLLSNSLHIISRYIHEIIGLSSRVILTTVLYRNMLRYKHSRVSKTPLGKLITLISVDMYKLDRGLLAIHYIWAYPIGIIFVIVGMWLIIGPSALVAMVIFLMKLPIGFVVISLIRIIRKKLLTRTDKKNKLFTEAINYIRIIKMFAWEERIFNSINKQRKFEIANYALTNILKALTLLFTHPITSFASLLTILTYWIIGGQLDAVSVFTLIGLIQVNTMLGSLFQLGILQIGEALVSITRSEDVLLEYEQYKDNITCNESIKIKNNDICLGTIKAIELTLSWEIHYNNQISGALFNVSFDLRREELLIVVGSVGSGKSTLLMGLLGECEKLKGTLDISGDVAFVSQQYWIFSDTIKNNITFGQKFDNEWYNKVLDACCLLSDIKLFPEGDESVIGERGITLSGGQKARLNLARAIYADKDIYLLDDPLSAVDPAVSRSIFFQCIRGLLSTKTVILATHQLQYADHADKLLVLDGGRVIGYGAPEQLKKMQCCAHIFEQPPAKQTFNNGYNFELLSSTSEAIDNAYDNSLAIEKSEPTNSQNMTQNCKIGNNKLLSGEIERFGTISTLTYIKYFWMGGYVWPLFSVLLCPIISAFMLAIGSNIYIVWLIDINNQVIADVNESSLLSSLINSCAINISSSNSSKSLVLFLGIFEVSNPLNSLSQNAIIILTIFVSLLIMCLFFCQLMFLYSYFLIIAYRIYKTILTKLLKAQMRFFDVNKCGPIITRFSKDIGFVDDILPEQYVFFITISLLYLFSFLSTVLAQWVSIFPLILTLALLLLARFYYLKPFREIKRMEAIAKNPILSHLSNTHHGLVSIRSLNLEQHMLNIQTELQNNHTKTWFYAFSLNKWFALRLELLIDCCIFVVQLIFIFLAHTTSPVLAALSLTRLISLQGGQAIIKYSSEIEGNMVSFERLLDYAKLPTEAYNSSLKYGNFKITKGEIRFQNVSLRYALTLPKVLDDITFTINSREKIGIVGRTGAGKSSIQVALLRLIEICEGQIFIDGTDCSLLNLQDLRREISVIPQDPVIFSGPLRYSLDPFCQFTNSQLWKALSQVQMEAKINSLQGKLDFLVMEGGANFSEGEKQLLCLARALLKNNSILILDEATSNVDITTDNLIQGVLREYFRNTTVLTIAHRIKTVIEYDRIVIMDAGRIVEQGTSQDLLEDKNSMLSQMVANMSNDND